MKVCSQSLNRNIDYLTTDKPWLCLMVLGLAMIIFQVTKDVHSTDTWDSPPPQITIILHTLLI